MKAIALATALIVVNCTNVTAQNAKFEPEAFLTLNIVAIATVCAEEPSNAQFAYAERVAKIAWGRKHSQQSEIVMKAALDHFNGQNLEEQAKICSGIKIALKNLK